MSLRTLCGIFAVVFALVVASGYVPAFIEMQGEERLMGGLFQLSLLDDITHGVTALAALAAALAGGVWCRRFLVVFGSYYGLDALFFLTWGFFNDKPWMADILLNLPHVAIAAIMGWAVSRHDRG